MSLKATVYRLIVWIVFLTCGLCPAMAQETKKFKVLAVMSYEDTYLWVQEIKEGIDSVLGKTCEIKYFYMETKKNPEGGPQKAKEAFELYQQFQPDGVITADDDAQKMFVIPYLKDKVKTPVMFCGVNAEPDKYGYPASNVSGILERLHIIESIAFIQQIAPSVKTFGFLYTDSPVADMVSKQVESESKNYSAEICGFKKAKNLKEVKELTEELKKQCDALWLGPLHGTPDDTGKPMTEKEMVPIVTKIFGKPTVGNAAHSTKFGALCSILHTGQEQGQTSAEMLLKAMQGTPVSQIPITRNQHGKRILNVQAMKELGISPKPAVLQGSELVKTEE